MSEAKHLGSERRRALVKQRRAEARDPFDAVLFGLLAVVAGAAFLSTGGWGLVLAAVVASGLAWATWTGRFFQ